MSIAGRTVIISTIAFLAIGFVTLLAIVGANVWLGERSQVYFNEVVAARDTRSAAVELRSSLQAAESSQRGYIATGNEIYLAPYEAAKRQTSAQLDKLKRSLAESSDAQRLLRRLSDVISDKIQEMDQTIAFKSGFKGDEALSLLRSNRGKALMDEANVFLSAIILGADERLTIGSDEQRSNAARLRLVSAVGGFIIVLVLAGAIFTVLRYTREIAAARDEVRTLNTTLEQRVTDRTADLARARDRAEVLLAEVNHRVANSLALVASLVKLQSNALTDRSAKQALEETQTRIFAISLVHKRLYSSGDVRFVSLDEYLTSLLDHLQTSMRAEGRGATLRYELASLRMRTDRSINLGVIATEWVTNAFKYAYPDRPGEVCVRLLDLKDGRAELVVEDEGVGFKGATDVKGTGLGTRIVKAMAETIGAKIEYPTRQRGTQARLVFPLKDAE